MSRRGSKIYVAGTKSDEFSPKILILTSASIQIDTLEDFCANQIFVVSNDFRTKPFVNRK